MLALQIALILGFIGFAIYQLVQIIKFAKDKKKNQNLNKKEDCDI